MRKLLVAAIALFPAIAHADDTRVTGYVSQQHIGTALSCFVVNGQWYAIPVSMGGGFLAQSVGITAAAQTGQLVEFLADPTPAINGGNPYLCHSTVPAAWAHDIDLRF